MQYLNAFWVGGLICAVGQLLIDKTKLTPARILVIFVTTGAILGGLGIYMVKKIMDEVSYEYMDGQNILRMRKSLSSR